MNSEDSLDFRDLPDLSKNLTGNESWGGETAPVTHPGSASAPASHPAAPSSVVPPAPGAIVESRWRYLLKERLGKGGYGSVYLARRLEPVAPGGAAEPPEEVAIKFFHSPHRADQTSMLKRELAAMLALECDRIPRLYDWSMQADRAFLVLQYFPHGSLYENFALLSGMNEASAWRLLSDLLVALRAAHQQSILHLDIKPGNVLLDGAGGYALTDFGISQGSLVSVAISGRSVGTLGYCAPEQRRMGTEAFDARTDLWGAGATVWSLATGIMLYHRRDLLDEEITGAKYGLPPIRKFRPEFSEALESALLELVARDPADRPGGAPEALQRIQRASRGLDLDSQVYAAFASHPASDAEIRELIASLNDPLWVNICNREGFRRYFVRYQDGDLLCREGEQSYKAFALLRGSVSVERAGRVIAVEEREGTFLGEIATLTGRRRTASLRARGEVWAAVFNAAELERFVTMFPGVAVRLIRSMAERLDRETAGKYQIPEENAPGE